MKIESIWTDNEGSNVLYALREKFGDKAPRTLIKYAVREYVESLRQKKMESRPTAQAKIRATGQSQKNRCSRGKVLRSVPHQKIEAQPAIPAPLIEIIARLIALFGPEEQHWMYAKLEQVHMESLANIRQHSNGAEPQGEITPFECALGLSKCSFGVSSGYCEQCCE